VVAQLTNQASLNNCLVFGFIIENFDWLMGCNGFLKSLGACRGVILLHGGGDGACYGCEFFKLVHDLDGLNEATCGVTC